MAEPTAYELDLSGWWHTHLEEGAKALDNGGAAPPPHPQWAHLEREMESLPVPGAWAAPTSGRWIAWQWRPLLVPEEWAGRRVWLRLGRPRGRVDVYLDADWIGGVAPGGATAGEARLALDVTERLRPGRHHELTLRTAAGGPAGGIGGPILLAAMSPGERPAGA